MRVPSMSQRTARALARIAGSVVEVTTESLGAAETVTGRGSRAEHRSRRAATAARPMTDDRWRLLEFEDADSRGPDAHRRVRGMERRRRGGLVRGRAPRGGLGCRGHAASTRRTTTTSRSRPEGDARRRATADRVAHHGSVARDTGFGSRDVVRGGHRAVDPVRAFTIERTEYAERLGVSTFVTLGALLADVPHTRPIPVTATRRRGRPPPARPRVERLRPDRSSASSRRCSPGRLAVLAAGRSPTTPGTRRRPRPPSACSASWSRSST